MVIGNTLGSFLKGVPILLGNNNLCHDIYTNVKPDGRGGSEDWGWQLPHGSHTHATKHSLRLKEILAQLC